MINKNVCPNCGQLYDTDLAKCPLCGAAPQVVETEPPVQRKRITDNERKQRRAERKQAGQDERRRKREELLRLEDEEEQQLEEERDRRREEKRRRQEQKQAASGGQAKEFREPLRPQTLSTPGPSRSGRPPQKQYGEPVKNRGRVPRFLVGLSFVLLLLTLIVGGSYLLWKLGVVKLSVYDKLANRQPEQTEVVSTGDEGQTEDREQAGSTRAPKGNEILCRTMVLDREEITFESVGDQMQLLATPEPEDTTEDRIFTSSDEKVVKVSPVGILTAVGPGEATVTVSCGDASAACRVLCTFEAPAEAGNAQVEVDHLELVKDDMSFFNAGEGFVLSVTNVPAGTPVSWSSNDESVATVDQGGHVKAVGPGTTKVVAQVGDLTAECWVRCKFE